jgi:hypothetical protein
VQAHWVVFVKELILQVPPFKHDVAVQVVLELIWQLIPLKPLLHAHVY